MGGSRILKGGSFIVVVGWPHPATYTFYCFPSLGNNNSHNPCLHEDSDPDWLCLHQTGFKSRLRPPLPYESDSGPGARVNAAIEEPP